MVTHQLTETLQLAYRNYPQAYVTAKGLEGPVMYGRLPGRQG